MTEDCWIWTAGHTAGYGSFRKDRKHIYAHRAMWELWYGPIPVGMFVLHRCDNPPCVRPDHLFLGTQKDNLADCATKGRVDRDKGRKLTDAQVRAYRERYASGEKAHTLAKESGMQLAYFYDVLKGRKRVTA